jgi:hypothetical protein
VEFGNEVDIFFGSLPLRICLCFWNVGVERRRTNSCEKLIGFASNDLDDLESLKYDFF